MVQALTQALNNQQRGQVRLRPIPTERRRERQPCSAKARPISPLSAATSTSRKRASGGDAAQERGGTVGTARSEGEGQEGSAQDHEIAQLAGRRVGVVGRTPANVNLLKVILAQYGVDPAKVEIIQFPANQAADAIRNQKADAYLAAGPVNSKITADAIAASTRDGGGTPKFLVIDLVHAIADNDPAYEASEIPAGDVWRRRPTSPRKGSRPS